MFGVVITIFDIHILENISAIDISNFNKISSMRNNIFRGIITEIKPRIVIKPIMKLINRFENKNVRESLLNKTKLKGKINI